MLCCAMLCYDIYAVLCLVYAFTGPAVLLLLELHLLGSSCCFCCRPVLVWELASRAAKPLAPLCPNILSAYAFNVTKRTPL